MSLKIISANTLPAPSISPMSEKASGRGSFGGRESESAAGGRKSVVKHVKNEELSSSYDYVMVFPMEKSSAGGFQQTPTAKYAVGEMNKAGLETFSYLSVQDDELIVLVRCPVRFKFSPRPCPTLFTSIFSFRLRN